MLHKILFTTLFLIGVVGANGQNNVIKASALIGNLGLQYERALGDRFALIGQVGHSNFTNSVNDVETTSNGLGFLVEGRYYLSKNKERMEGWHIGVFYSAMNTESSEGLQTNIASLGIASGYQWVFGSHISLGLVFGAGTFDYDSDQDRGLLLEGLTFWPHLGLSLGYRL
ncbi:DUF3575 domain-containing protein [Maribacter sp. 2307ULW6-5]|uniref:DUF3575 domain-containing protein n=1 Tax=Maribacter sp. 2307ULW6-5 TaxID=3386275 RepID=UPI0039BC6126